MATTLAVQVLNRARTDANKELTEVLQKAAGFTTKLQTASGRETALRDRIASIDEVLAILAP